MAFTPDATQVGGHLVAVQLAAALFVHLSFISPASCQHGLQDSSGVGVKPVSGHVHDGDVPEAAVELLTVHPPQHLMDAVLAQGHRLSLLSGPGLQGCSSAHLSRHLLPLSASFDACLLHRRRLRSSCPCSPPLGAWGGLGCGGPPCC
ncbi:hypothetical protein V8C86DRAFT_2907478 [Haematococcus lacustris]